MPLYDDPTHTVDIYLPIAPTTDSGGGVVLNWAALPSQTSVPCQINTYGSSGFSRSSRALRQKQNTITVWSRIGFKTEALQITLVQGMKLIATDTGRTFIVQALESPNRAEGGIPALSYVTCEEIL